ncbi:MAG: aminotransferase class I/II-fold pyridoxal phosphate-dependent enzyme [Acidobacteriia bacterium]|nr:aminotransferase class I/II-fold pyridoxal phosphate-dependent enzyme [Terriglobia bacterium]
MKIETRAVHAGRKIESGSRDVSSAIHMTTTFERAEDGSFPGGYIYSRESNPNRAALEAALASLEEGAAALAFSSGSAATMSVLQALAPGDHVIAGEDVFYGSAILMKEILGPWGLKMTQVDMRDPAAVERALTPSTRIIWIETPSNPLINITDIRAITALARKAGVMTVCDNTWPTPLLQQPLLLGVDVSMHSVTKYLSGHSDVLNGALIFREKGAFYDRVHRIQHQGGAVPSPFECWLTLRGLQTFPYRVRAQSQSAMKIAEFLSGQKAIEAVHYPGLPTHAGHRIAAGQMTGGFGGMLSIQVRGGQPEAFKLAASLKLFTRATSLGGTHSLIEHRASVEGPTTHSPQNLLRISIGLEHTDDLIEDLSQALGRF